MPDPFSLIGQTISHYRVLDKIGAGGMGEVYRAHDEQLDRDVALKVLPAGMLADEAARKQFRKEALALAKLNHPNIETVFEFSTQDDVDFLSMELIPGRSLSTEIKQGPVAEREALRLGMQLAEGLTAAHDRGVIHRDLKPANLFLTPDGRLKILDFGLAKFFYPELGSDVTQSMSTENSTFSGTLPYMSPEQLRGLPADPRSDIYAAGAVLYEMTTGQRPFPQTRSTELIGAILHQAAAPPRSLNPQVSQGLERVINKALEKESTQRYQTARELHAALETVASASTGVVSMTSWERGLRRGTLAAAGGTLIIMLAIGLLFGLNVRGVRDRFFARNRAKAPAEVAIPATPIKPRRSVAVLGFKNLSGRPDEAWLSTALSEMLTTELAAGEKLRTVPGENVAQIKVGLSLPDADSYGPGTLQRIHQSLNADDVVLGSYLLLGKGQIRLDLRLQNTEQGEMLAAVSLKGSEQEIDDLVSRAGTTLREKLGAGTVSDAEASTVRTTLPKNIEAARLYSEGLAKVRAFEFVAARDLLQRAIVADAKFPLAHAALANSLWALGYHLSAREEAKKAYDLSATLGREDRMWVEAEYRQRTSEWDKAVEIYRTLFQLFPDNLEYGLALANAQNGGGNPSGALQTLETLRKLPLPQGDEPRIDRTEARIALSMADYKRMQAAATRGVEKGRARGTKLVVARALIDECWASHTLGQPTQAIATCQEAERTFSEAGDRDHAAIAILAIGGIHLVQGDIQAARAKYEEALSVFREVGDEEGVATSLGDLGQLIQDQGDLNGAQEMYQQVLWSYRKVKDKSGEAWALALIGDVLEYQGDLPGAKVKAEQALALNRQLGNKQQQTYNLLSLAKVSFWRADLNEANGMLVQIEPLLQQTGDKRGELSILTLRSVILAARDDLKGAREKDQEALRIANEIKEKGRMAEIQTALANLSVEEGHPSEAEAPCAKAIDEFRVENNASAELYSHIVLARALLAMGRLPDAKNVVDGARNILPKSQLLTDRWDLTIVGAQVQAAMGDFTAVEKTLYPVLGEATKLGFIPYQFEVRLTLGGAEMRSAKAAARARLAALEKDATAKGFLLIARKAHAVAGQ